MQDDGRTLDTRSLAIIGTRGYPSYYGGFETAVRVLSPYLVDQGWNVTVYSRPGSVDLGDPTRDSRVETRMTWGVETNQLSTLTHGLTASISAAREKPDVALLMNVANGHFLPILKAAGVPTVVNVDGIEWNRAKWNGLGKWAFHRGARKCARSADILVADSEHIRDYWRDVFGVDSVFIPYGGTPYPTLSVPFGLEHRGYVLMIARFVPENSIEEFFEAVPKISATCDVVIVGDDGVNGRWDKRARELSTNLESVRWLGRVADDELVASLWQHAGVYFHGHSVGGTNPSLVQAMTVGAPTVARDTPFNREVLGSTGTFVNPDPNEIAAAICYLMRDQEAKERFSRSSIERAATHYSWESVCSTYADVLEKASRRRRSGRSTYQW